MSANKQQQKGRPFPWLCSDCVTRTVVPTVMDFTTKVKHDGVIQELHLPQIDVPRCQTCGNTVVTTAIDECVNEALRSKLHLLSPEQIRANLAKLGLNQQELADWLDVAPETVSRWMTGALIQSSRMNKRLRMFFAFPAARDMLRRLDEDPQLGMVACPEREPDNVSHTKDNGAEQETLQKPTRASTNFHLPPGEEAKARARADCFGSLGSPCPSSETPSATSPQTHSAVLPAEQLSNH